MKANEVVFKTTKIKSYEHYITHSEYLKKDNAIILQNVSEKQMLEVINLDIKRQNENFKGKRGRPPQVAKGLVFSIPKDMEKYILKMNEKELRKLIDAFLDTLYQDIKKMYPKANMSFLKKNTQIVLHKDSGHLHFHCLLPQFTKHTSLFNDKLISINYGKRTVSMNARRRMFNALNALKNIDEEMTLEEFKEKQKSIKPSDG